MANENILKKKIFKGKTLEDLYEEIHIDINNIKETIEATLEVSLPHMKERVDVQLMLPLVTNLLATNIKNTTNLTKIAEILTKSFVEKDVKQNDDSIDSDNVFNELDAILKQRKESQEKVLLLNNKNDR